MNNNDEEFRERVKQADVWEYYKKSNPHNPYGKDVVMLKGKDGWVAIEATADVKKVLGIPNSRPKKP